MKQIMDKERMSKIHSLKIWRRLMKMSTWNIPCSQALSLHQRSLNFNEQKFNRKSMLHFPATNR